MLTASTNQPDNLEPDHAPGLLPGRMRERSDWPKHHEKHSDLRGVKPLLRGLGCYTRRVRSRAPTRTRQKPRKAGPPAATPSHVQRPSSPPMTMLACTQGLDTPLSDTLAHSYAPRCTPGLSPCLYKREVQGHPEGGSRGGSGGRALCPPSLSLTRRACNPYCERHPCCRIIQGLSHILCSIPRQPIWAGTRSDNLLVGPGTPGVETPTILDMTRGESNIL
jgi:hypothetical protein